MHESILKRNSKQIKVSVIIPTYNREKYLNRCISSVLKQTYSVDEVILINNNSNDNTINLVKREYPYIKIYNEKKRGVSSARNLGIRKSSNQWIAFLDSDDEWKSSKIEKQVSRLLKYGNKYKIIHTNEIWVKNGKYFNQKFKHKKKEGYLFNDCLNICKISPSSVLMNKSLFLKYGLFDNRLMVCEDYELWLRITSKVLVGYLDEPLVIKYGGHEGQLSKKYWGMDRFRVKALEELILKYNLNVDQKYWAIETLLKKIRILIVGAKKRKNLKLFNYYRNKERYWKKIIL